MPITDTPVAVAVLRLPVTVPVIALALDDGDGRPPNAGEPRNNRKLAFPPLVPPVSVDRMEAKRLNVETGDDKPVMVR